MAGILENARLQGPSFIDVEKESDTGTITHVSRFIVKAELKSGGSMFETVKIGKDQLIGEIIRLEGDIATLQVFENTSGLQVGDSVVRTYAPLSVELGPGLLNTAFDGVQRPLEAMTGGENNTIYAPRSNDIPALDRVKLWDFRPKQLKVGDYVTGGDIFGTVHETTLMPQHGIMLPPKEAGRITYIAPEGQYTVLDEVLRIESLNSEEKSFSMMHRWPVRTPRPFVEKLSFEKPFVTGQRVFDAMFPLAVGGTCAIPALYGSGVSGTLYSIHRSHNKDVLVHVAIGGRGNDVAELLMEIPETYTRVQGVDHSLMSGTCVIGNTANMPLGTREAAIYSGVTTAEYYRDQGFNVGFIADSTGRWAEALKEVHNFSDMPSSQGYPPWIGSRVATFYDRAGRVSCFGTPDRVGSITMVTTVTPVGDHYFEDQFTSAVMGTCQTFWALDRNLAQRKHFPSVNCLQSYTRYLQPLTPFYEDFDGDFIELRNKIMDILEKEAALHDTILIVGKDNLSERDALIVRVAGYLKFDFLMQNLFTPYDKISPHYKTVWMMRNWVAYYTLALQAIEKGITMKAMMDNARIANALYLLTRAKFQDPHDGQETVCSHMRDVNRTLHDAFNSLYE